MLTRGFVFAACSSAALFAGASIAGCASGSGPALSETGSGAGPSWEEFRANPPVTWEQFVAITPREPFPPYGFIVDGDIVLSDEQKLARHYEEWLRQEYDSLGRHGSELTVRNVLGADVLWSIADRFNLTYCISNDFGANKASVITAMDAATRSWSERVGVQFAYRSGEDAMCTSANTNVVFNVSPAVTTAFFAASFFPDDVRANRQLLITTDAMTTTQGGRDFQGILRHETGHILGFRHEHIWITCTGETTADARQVTSYDVNSVMHYPQCRPSGTGGYRQTALDYSGAISLYGYASDAGTTLDPNLDGHVDIVWHNRTTGELSAWLLNGASVLGAESLSWRCDTASGCASAWTPIATGDFNYDGQRDLLWFNPQSGVLSPWLMNGATVVGTADLAWHCDAASGCSSAWRPIGTGDFNRDGRVDLLWHNAQTGELSVWLLNGAAVTGTQSLSWRCDAASGCSSAWRAVAVGDFNKDGLTDVLWHNAQTGELSAWILNGAGTVVTAQSLAWRCDAASGCSSQWKVVGSGDFNQDGRRDLLWYNATTGQVSAWLLDGTTVLGTMELGWTCDAASGCASQWRLVGKAE
jgi:hypothetical protein